MTENDSELLAQFTRDQSQDAFSELVNRHLNLVYSAALRQVRSPELAEEISLSVFSRLATHATKLPQDTIVTAGLYKVACNSAIDAVRREARRQAREQIAFQMSALNEPAPDWTAIESMLDEAMQSLDDADRAAILLRFFENKSLREVGQALGASDDAAQKRVSRALERLREFFTKRKVGIGAASLAALVSANAVTSAPIGLAPAISSGALAGVIAISAPTATTITLTKILAMTTLQKTIAALVLTGAVAVGLYQARQLSTLRGDLQRERDQKAALNTQLNELARAHGRATNLIAAITGENDALKKRPSEVIKLRGEVGALKQQNAKMGSSSALSKVTADPASKKLMRDGQKAGMGVIYKTFATKLNLTPEQTDKMNDLLADHIMQNVDNVTTILRDKSTPGEMNTMFNTQEAALQQQIQDLLGPDGLTQYQEYTQNLLASLTSEQFKDKLTGTPDEQATKAAQLSQLLEQQSQAVLAANNLPADYQTVPILNFRNIASEQTAAQGLQLLTDIYQQTAAQASFLSPGALASSQQFGTTAINNNRASLTLNRNMMAPISN
jgi:RNA polymerase sigma factor (sigma-70 family)